MSKEAEGETEERNEEANVLNQSPSPPLLPFAKVEQTAGEDTAASSDDTVRPVVSSPRSHAEEMADSGSPPVLLVGGSSPTRVSGSPEASPHCGSPSQVAPCPGSDD
ncbi:unnamed protein product [Dibothriocephalus latus]|uniref:Uncharacterized protein n=1 Tax=Dibothriocephalus latus TaxID=60516 RepID=A0A3P7RA49_DIBLA|nr:unnamed protein product [Dibothriocephalus latus]